MVRKKEKVALVKKTLSKLFVVPVLLFCTGAQADISISNEDMQGLADAYQLLSDGDLRGAQEAYKELRTSVESLEVQRAATEGEAFTLMSQLNQLSEKSRSGATIGPLLRGRQRITVNFIADQLEAHSSETLSYLLSLAESDLKEPKPDYSQLAFVGDLEKLSSNAIAAEPVKVEEPDVMAAVETVKPKVKPAPDVTVAEEPAKPTKLLQQVETVAEPERVEKALANLVKMPTTNVKVRSGPGRTFKHIGSVKKGDRLIVDQRISVSGGGDWYHLVRPDGYVAASLFTEYTAPVAKKPKVVEKPKPAVVAIKPKPAPVKAKPAPAAKPQPPKPPRKKASTPKGACAQKNSGIVLRTSTKVRVLASPGGKTLLHYNPNVSISNVIADRGGFYVLRIRSGGGSVCGYVRKTNGVKRIR